MEEDAMDGAGHSRPSTPESENEEDRMHRELKEATWVLLRGGGESTRQQLYTAVRGEKKIEEEMMMRACRVGDDMAVEALSQHASMIDSHGATPLIVASSSGHYGTMMKLIGMRCDINFNGKCGSALHAAVKSGNSHTTELLLEAPCFPSPLHVTTHTTPLHIAVSSASICLVTLLLAHDADPSIPNVHGATPSSIAVSIYIARKGFGAEAESSVQALQLIEEYLLQNRKSKTRLSTSRLVLENREGN